VTVRKAVTLIPTHRVNHHAGAREPGGSPWLGRRGEPTEAFQRYQDIERAAQALWPWQTASAVSPSTALGARVQRGAGRQLLVHRAAAARQALR